MKARKGAIAWGLVAALANGCHKTSAQSDDAGIVAEAVNPASPATVGASNPEAGAGAETDVVPPVPPLVPADPSIPLHEAVVGAAPIAADNAAPIAPPAAPVAEDQPPQPEADDTWIPGYWWWSAPLARYVWVSGAWRHPPPDQVWTPGAWSPVGASYVWAPGYWAPQGFARVTIDVAPPPLQLEVSGNAPGVGFVWTPGYYGYTGGGYAWVGGVWARPPSAGVGWIAPRYVGFGRRYYLQPGRWDFAPDRRGVAYRPEIDARPGDHLRLVAVPRGVIVAHANYVSACSHAIAMGATRRPGGGFIMPHGGEVHAGEGRPGERGPHDMEGHAGVEGHAGAELKAKSEPGHEEREHEPAPQREHPASSPQHAGPAEHPHAAPPIQRPSGGGKHR
jgi:YXWGXW repeat-containing protein